VFASCITRVQLYVNECNGMAAVCAAAPLALANQLPLTRLYSALVRSSCKLRYIRIRPLKQGVIALTGRNHTDPPCSVGRPSSVAVVRGHAPGRAAAGSPACRQRYRQRQTTTTDDDRCQPAKQYWPIRRASNKPVSFNHASSSLLKRYNSPSPSPINHLYL